MIRSRLSVAGILFATLFAIARGDDKLKYQDSTAPVEARVDDLLGRMTMEEKIDMIAGVSPAFTVANKRLGIPSIVMADGRMGVRDWYTKSTVYPAGIALAASWDCDLATRFGEQMARDAHARGVDIWLGPMMNMYRTPVGGRNFECAGEDPYLDAQISVAEVKAIQAGGVMATAVIFCCNDQDFGHQPGLTRHTADSIVDERTLREIYYPPFEALAKDAHVGAFMASYNLLNGAHCTQNGPLLNDLLKGEWGYTGLVMSDWGATHDTVGAANGGLDLEMPDHKYFNRQSLLPAIQSGTVKPEVIDDKVRRLLREFFTFGFFDHDQKDTSIPMDNPESDALALTMAQREIVLLKNEGNLLPLDRKKIHSIAVLGPNADPAVWSGSGSSYGVPYHSTSTLDGFRAAGGGGIEVTTVPWHQFPPAKPAPTDPPTRPVADLIADSVKAAKAADVAVVCIGFKAMSETIPRVKNFSANEGEGGDRTYALPPGQADLIQQVVAANPHTIVILNAGGGVDWAGWLDKVPALIDAFYPGQAGGRALADIIFGDVNPSGKLPITLGKTWADTPSTPFYDHVIANKAVYGEGIFAGYRGYDKNGTEPQFPFGFGLSYTTFAYSNLHLDAGSISNADRMHPQLTAHFDVKNTGTVPGAEIAEVYVADPHASVPRPPRELKSFARVELAPGETKTIQVDLDARAFSFYDVAGKAWKFEPGTFQIDVGSSSRTICLSQAITL